MATQRRSGLGRGLGALIPEATDTRGGQSPSGTASATAIPADSGDPALVPVPGTAYAEIPVDLVDPNPRQPRQVFDEEALAELVHSISSIGLLQPVVVRPAAQGRYELVAGERRLRATRLAGLERIPAVIRETDDDVLLRDALLENLHRSQLNPLEEAAAYSQLLADFGCTQEELAQRLGRSRPQIANTIRLLRLPPAVQRRVAAGVLSAGHARAILSLEDPQAMEALAQRTVAEGLSVRSVEEIVALGVADETPRRRRGGGSGARGRTDAAVEISARLADRLDTKVEVELGGKRGRIVITFAALEDLERIAAVIEGRAPQLPH